MQDPTGKIRINYQALREKGSEDEQLSEELLKKAKSFFGKSARKELVRILDVHIRQLASQAAQRQVHPQVLCNAGRDGLFEALKLYEIGNKDTSFKAFATPFIRQAMERARATHTGQAPPV